MGDLGNQLKGLNQFTILEPASAASLSYFEQIPDSEKDQEAQKITANLQTQRAEILYRLGRFKETVDVLNRARPYFANPKSLGYSELQTNYIDSQISKCELQIGLTANARAGLEGTSEKIKDARKNIAQVTERDLNLLLIAAVASIWVDLVDNQLPAAQELADEAHALLVEYESANPGVKDFAVVPHHCKLAEQRSLTRLLQNNVEDLPTILQPQIDRARSLLSSTATTSQQRSNVSYLGRILGILGDYHMFRNNIAEARKLYQESYDLLQRASGDKLLVMPADEIHSDVWLGFAQVRMGIISLANPNRNMPQAQSHFANAKKTLDAALLDQKVDQEMGKTMMRVIKNAAPLLMQNTASLSRESKIYLLQTMMEFQQRY